MKYADMFHKLVYVNRDDPSFEEGVSPSISAEQLNSIQDGLEAALDCLDKNNADIETLTTHTTNIECEVVNKEYTITSDAWTYNSAKMRYEATITDDTIHTYNDVKIQLDDDTNGTVSISMLKPKTGYVTVYTNQIIESDITVGFVVREIRRIAEEV